MPSTSNTPTFAQAGLRPRTRSTKSSFAILRASFVTVVGALTPEGATRKHAAVIRHAGLDLASMNTGEGGFFDAPLFLDSGFRGDF
jgi:hypothetical protein